MNFNYLEKTIYQGTKHLLEECRINKPQAFVYISSGAVYGKQSFPVLMEEASLLAPPINDLTQAYGHFKRMAELLCHDFQKETGIPVSVARLFAFAGKRLDINGPFAITNFIRNVINNEEIIIHGDGSALRSYMNAKDLCHWLLTISSKNKSFDIINVGSDFQISILELAELICKLTNRTFKTLNSNVDKNYYVPSIYKAKTKYGLNVNLDLENSITEMIFYQKNKREGVSY